MIIAVDNSFRRHFGPAAAVSQFNSQTNKHSEGLTRFWLNVVTLTSPLCWMKIVSQVRLPIENSTFKIGTGFPEKASFPKLKNFSVQASFLETLYV